MKLQINGVDACTFIKRAYDLGDNLNGLGRYEINDPIQTELRHVRAWIQMAEQDALHSRKKSK